MAISGTDWLEVPIIFLGLFLRAEFQGIYCQYMAKNMVQYLHFRILEFPLKTWLAP
jgi:hypothetical protein